MVHNFPAETKERRFRLALCIFTALCCIKDFCLTSENPIVPFAQVDTDWILVYMFKKHTVMSFHITKITQEIGWRSQYVILKGLGDIFTCDINIKNPPDNK